MNKHSSENLAAYFSEANSWNRDRVESTRTSLRIAWRVAAAAALIAILEAVALAVLTPLKTIEPYTLMVDRTTGYVQALKPLDQAQITPDSALTQAFLAQYVVARESFDLATLNTSYRKAALWSLGDARGKYLQQMQSANPQNPLNLYPRDTIVETRVKSVSPIGENTALVRFDTLRTDQGNQPRPSASWVAVIRYRYSNAPMKLEDRFVNPLGFQVTSYRKDSEAVSPPPPTARAPSAGAGWRAVGVPAGQYQVAEAGQTASDTANRP